MGSIITCLKQVIIYYGIPVRYVSSMIVILNAKFARLLAGRTNKKDDEERGSPTTVPCFASRNTLTFNYCRSLGCARKKRVYYMYILSNNLCKLIEI